jgi:uncharacterized protein
MIKDITKILILSDTHLTNNVIPEWLSVRAELADYVIHAGDFASKDAYDVMNAWKNKEGMKKLVAVWGNGDGIKAYGLKGYTETTKGGIKIGLVHNPFEPKVWKPENLPKYFPQTTIDNVVNNLSNPNFKDGFYNLTNIAKALDVQVLVFGHSHHPMIANGDRLLICPGRSSNAPLAEVRNSAASMAWMNLEDGNIRVDIFFEKLPSDLSTARCLKANH